MNEISKESLSGIDLYDNKEIADNCDIVISIGGDGTLLQAAYDTRYSSTPLLGLNYGKLGFLAEFDLNKIDELIQHLKNNDLIIEKRNTLDAKCTSENSDDLYAINDVVIDRGNYPKMIEITILVDDEYVATYSADGIIIATPTGSTGYSLSTGGPIVNPKTESITLSPISPHTLTMRPLVISSYQKVTIKATSPYKNVQVISDGQRVNYFNPPAIIEITRSKYDLRLVHKSKEHYYEILRKKLFWGIDIRTNKNNGE
jgi:NAD+ kinase